MVKKLKVTLSIGYVAASHEDILEIELTGEETSDELEEIAQETALEWSQNYIELSSSWEDE